MMMRTTLTLIFLSAAVSGLAGCDIGRSGEPANPPAVTAPAVSSSSKDTVPPATVNPAPAAGTGTSSGTQAQAGTNSNSTAGSTGKGPEPATKPVSTPTPVTAQVPSKGGAIQVVAQPESIIVLVNKHNALPESYEPKDLVYPNVAFTFSEKIDKRKMRKEAATALEALFEGAKKDGISLAGVSAYRSFATQNTLFNNYVKQDGEEKAKTYSALPGHSEHETGLAIDVSGSNGKCAAQNCFAATKEADWLDGHASEYGFIIRYPKGKESITGYQYEPWHLRYVGIQLSKEIAAKDVTLEEYSDAIPVTK